MSVADLLAGARFVGGLPALLRRPVTPEAARATLAERLARREADFRATLARVLRIRRGPYAALLRHAGCEQGDLDRLVRLAGIEGTLEALARAGVYLSVDEFKGRAPIVRNGRVVVPTGLGTVRSWAAAGPLAAQTSGSGGARASVPINLAAIRAWAVDAQLDYQARGGLGWRHARWTVPGGDSIAFLLLFCAFGAVPDRWFSQLDVAAPLLQRRYRWSARVARWTARLAGTALPRPEHVPFDDPRPVVEWMAAERRLGRVPHLVTYASSAVRACEAAVSLGFDVSGSRFSVTGEPITAARLAAVRRAGAEAAPYYGSVDAGLIGAGCLAPSAPDDVHVHHDLVTLVRPDGAAPCPGLRPSTLLVSAFHPAVPVVLLNVSLGDQGVLETRACGCPLERLGWTRHLHTIRSFEKLTVAGMTFLDVDVVRALEETLPARCGGGPTDYQLVEHEDSDGRPRLRLLVHPRLRDVTPESAKEAFFDALMRGRGPERVMGLQWRQAGILHVDRRVPITGASGKVLHLHRLPRARAKVGP